MEIRKYTFAFSVVGLAALGAGPAPAAEPGSPSDPNLLYVGRWDRHDPASAESNWGGAYLRARFTGTSVECRATSNGGFMVSLDGETPRELAALASESLKPGEHTLLLGSPAQNIEITFHGLKLAPGGKTLPVPPRPVVEFVGDSITAFGGKPPTVNYAWQSAEADRADHVQIAFAGRALTTGFGCGKDKAGMDRQYFCLKNFSHLKDAPQTPWDFSYTPAVVAINLGQNDQCGREPQETMKASYIRFVDAVRAKFPKATILAVRPFGGPYEHAIRSAVEALNAAGDHEAHFVDTTGWLEKADYVDGVHPSEAGHQKVARRLAPILEKYLAPTRQP